MAKNVLCRYHFVLGKPQKPIFRLKCSIIYNENIGFNVLNLRLSYYICSYLIKSLKMGFLTKTAKTGFAYTYILDKITKSAVFTHFPLKCSKF